MTAPRDPWADPATDTAPGAPYAGPPATVPPPAWGAAPGWAPAPPGWGPAPPGWGPVPPGWADPGRPPPAGPRRPGQVVAAAVLAFVQAALVGLTSAYLLLVASVFALSGGDPAFPWDGGALATEATALALVQIASVVLLVAAGVLALTRRGRAARGSLLAAHGVQVALAVYWGVRLVSLAGAAVGSGASGVLLVAVLCFAAMPAVGLGLLVGAPARAWFSGAGPAASPGGGAAGR
ncbi:hypothetical protein [Geodermatophilus marinus]|uniref:hypothetical protein n=1 Tax=Geodermatophilus sp. LHW52908 TaxID=2303986 RepID=UPI000E3BA385|nr:hypothetical protein [Geodermatophilus sp. LHW52908]RFU22623.1 hypothetical protein D0Z06_05165 [Geodermatophilus sp. LHW52908]